MEDHAARYLLAQGLSLLHRNYQCRFGEIDLIFLEKETLVFVEVRYRHSSAFGSPVETIGRQKQRKLIRTAYWYLNQFKSKSERACRFDVIALTGSQDTPSIEWIKGAFEEEG